MASTKIDLNHNRVARIQDLDELATVLFPGNRNHQRCFLAVWVELKWAPDQFLPTLEPVADKWKAFGWNVLFMDGNDMWQVLETLNEARQHKGGPTVIVAKTVKGKGVSFMENNPKYHGTAPTPQEVEAAMKELA